MKVTMQGKKDEKSFGAKIKHFFKKLYRGIDGVLFPANIKCLICGRDLPKKQEIEFCPECAKRLDKIEDDKCCKVCGKMLKTSNICLNCKTSKREFDLARAVYSYHGQIQKLIIDFKYENKPYIARTLGKVLADKFSELNWKPDLVIPVPLTRRRYKIRGYNQAELLAEEFVRRTGLVLNTNVLNKTKETEQQAKLGFKDRQNNLKKTFKITNADAVKDKTVLIIDDVFTTGATANACAISLKEAGAKKVFVLCVASTPTELPAV